MHRTQIYIDENEWGILKELASKSRVSVSDLVRKAISKVYFTEKKLDLNRALDEISGLWTDREFNGTQFIRNLRSSKRKTFYEDNS